MARCPPPKWPKRSRSTRSRPTRSIRCTPDRRPAPRQKNNQENNPMATVEVKVPDIGDFKDVAVIELLVKPGDTIKPEQSLITVESDKASMEIPSTSGGVVKELRVKLGDKVSEGTVLLVVESDAAAPASARPAAASASSAAAPGPAPAKAAVPAQAPSSGGSTGPVEIRVPDIGDFKDVAVIELLAKPGDVIKPEQSLITVE